MMPIEGPRFHCQVCANFDFCQGCFNKGQAHNHAFERIDDHGQSAVYVGSPRSRKKALKYVRLRPLPPTSTCCPFFTSGFFLLLPLSFLLSLYLCLFLFFHFAFFSLFAAHVIMTTCKVAAYGHNSFVEVECTHALYNTRVESVFFCFCTCTCVHSDYMGDTFCRRKKKKIRGGSVVMEWDQIVRHISVSSNEDCAYRLMDGNQTTCWQSSGTQGKASVGYTIHAHAMCTCVHV